MFGFASHNVRSAHLLRLALRARRSRSRAPDQDRLTLLRKPRELASHDIAGPMHETNSYWSIYVGNDA